jgi:outer membrane protein
MKKIILTVAAVFALSFANAQDKKESKGFGFSEGDIFVEGSLTMNSTNDKNTEVKTSSTDFAPKAGYLVSDNFAVGLSLGIESGKTTTAGTNTSKTSGFHVGAFGRYYFLELGERFKTYTEFGFSIGSDKVGVTSPVKTNTFDLGAGLGMNYFVTPKVAISFGLGNVINYGTSKTDVSGDKGENSMNVNVNVFNNFFNTPTFGALYKF